MVQASSTAANDHPVDLTEALPLDDENVLARRATSVWRRYRWPIVGVVVVLVGGGRRADALADVGLVDRRPGSR